MEVEKSLFKIHERILGVPCCPGFMRTCFSLLLLITLFIMGIFIFGNIKYKDQNNILKPHYENIKQQNNYTDPPSETIYNIIVADYEFNKSNVSQILVNSLYLHIMVSGNPHILGLDQDLRTKYNFTVFTMYIHQNEFYSNEFERNLVREVFTFETIMINQIIYTFDKIDKFIKNSDTSEVWSFYKSDLENIQWSKEPVKAFFLRLLGVIKIIFGLFLVSNTTAIYVIITVISAPMLLLGFFECCIRFGNQNENARLTFYKAFPWIGIYLYALQFNNKKQYCYVLMAFLCMIIVFYTFYISCIMLWNSILFNISFKRGADQNLYGYIIFLEFSSLLFIRTRTSLRFYPPMIFFLLFSYLFYINFNAYALFGAAFLLLFFIILTVLSGFLAFMEIPALSWNSSYHYAPSLHKPRTLFFPMFNLSWFYDLPQIWTFFYPLHGRSTFNPSELSLVDRNYLLLNQTLENAVNQQAVVNPMNEGFGQGNLAGNNIPIGQQQQEIPIPDHPIHQNYNPQNNL